MEVKARKEKKQNIQKPHAWINYWFYYASDIGPFFSPSLSIYEQINGKRLFDASHKHISFYVKNKTENEMREKRKKIDMNSHDKYTEYLKLCRLWVCMWLFKFMFHRDRKKRMKMMDKLVLSNGTEENLRNTLTICVICIHLMMIKEMKGQFTHFYFDIHKIFSLSLFFCISSVTVVYYNIFFSLSLIVVLCKSMQMISFIDVYFIHTHRVCHHYPY